jgi:hypothetical protein
MVCPVQPTIARFQTTKLIFFKAQKHKKPWGQVLQQHIHHPRVVNIFSQTSHQPNKKEREQLHIQ